ncbi:hypothetical protein MTO96_049477 [Rhipicephalus appendiculatus]
MAAPANQAAKGRNPQGAAPSGKPPTAGGDQRHEELCAHAEMDGGHKPGKQSPREKGKWSPMQAACVALIVLCVLLAVGLVGIPAVLPTDRQG